MTKTQLKELHLNHVTGVQFAQIFNLKVNRKGQVKTQFGIKNIEGIGAVIRTVISDETRRLAY